MNSFQILCVTMHQKDFSKIAEMNIHSDVIFANQSDHTLYQETVYDGKHKARMITTTTRGVGKNRNIALSYADADYCLFADDDVRYCDDMEQIVLSEFQNYPNADIFVFHFDSDDPVRKQKKYDMTRRHRMTERMPWGSCRIAIKYSAIQKANLWFTTLFGGGCMFPSGEDSLWLSEAKKAGLRFYVSDKTIGTVSYATSSWFTGYDEKMFFGKGAFYAAAHPSFFHIWMLYFAFRTQRLTEVPLHDRIRWMKAGRAGYHAMCSFEDYKRKEIK